VDVCSQHLLTPFGLRSLSADDPAYIGKYGGDRYQRDAAYHQGTIWGWLMGPYLSAHWRVYQNPQQIRAYLELFQSQLRTHGLASISEIFDGDPPHNARGCISQAWSVAEILRVWDEISK
jgi:glycogen debranching enzyme